ncbi:homeobox-like domain superfamily [Holotrichia oblita]|uniref:Homeobox-like domain superfamily n=1 Tax=Holotrichia oblita TaxID=644536 RepID=A0ACB9TC85_HOLOL|nr:homeobox-like domain superfamily [Holotrichia oblita]
MPRKYYRRSNKASWTEENLRISVERIKNNSLNANQANRMYNIPYRTLKRRSDSNIMTKRTLRKHPLLGYENEIRPFSHKKRLQQFGFAPTASHVRSIAYNFAKSIGKENIFGPKGITEEKAGEHWFRSFMERSSD